MKLAVFVDCQLDLRGQPSVDLHLVEVLADPTPGRIAELTRTLTARAKKAKRPISLEHFVVDTDEAIR